MRRTVVSKADIEKVAPAGFAAGQPQTADDYRDRLLKYIPADVVAIYLTLTGLIKSADPKTTPVQTLGWIVFGVLLVVSIPWQRKVVKIEKWGQIAIGTGAFVVWAISLGGPFATALDWYRPLYASMLLALYTFLIPLLEI